MSSTFAGFTLFNSGPHRFGIGPAGRLLDRPLRGSNSFPYSLDRGIAELEIIQSGRLIATTESALWSLYDTIKSKAEAPTNGTLTDHSGKQWTDMTLVSFEPTGPLDRGRTLSLPYKARYLRFAD